VGPDDDWPTPVVPGGDVPAPVEPVAAAQQTSGPQQGGGLTVTDVRRLWPEVLEEVKNRRRFTWILLSQNAHVADLTNGTLVLAMPNVGARDSFARGGSEDILRDSLITVMGADLKIETMVDPSAGPGGSGGRGGPRPAAPPSRPSSGEPSVAKQPESSSSVATDVPPAPSSAASPRTEPVIPPEGRGSGGSGRADRAGAPADRRPGGADDPPPWATGAAPAADEWEIRDAAAHRDDEVLDEVAMTHTQLLEQRLGAEIIAEEESGA
jgi:DNA polymerase III subunit gamma/tau